LTLTAIIGIYYTYSHKIYRRNAFQTW